jgi:hypothetical protein
VERDPQVSTFTLDDLERRLQAEGLRVVNLAGPFRRLAAQELPKGRFVYPLDDSHWSPLGVRLAAEEIARAWR